MTDNVRELRPRASDSEKITINLGYVDLGQVDLMVQEGFYSNRTDFIRTAIRNQLERHSRRPRRVWTSGCGIMPASISKGHGAPARCCTSTFSVWRPLTKTSRPSWPRATIASVSVLGALHATPAVKAALADRTR
ncbi:hypothetical protein ACVWWO_003711 [Bradyrhizobium sp. F1.13.1]